jgi:type VI secretion system secreted protein VgrG
MNSFRVNHKPQRLGSLAYAAGLTSIILALVLGLTGGVSQAAPLGATAPGLGTAAACSDLGKAGVTNSGNSSLSGNVGADLDAAITGFPPGTSAGKISAPAVNQPELDAAAADAGLTSQAGSATAIGPNLSAVVVGPGVYSVGAALLPGVLTLDGPGVYVFLATALTGSGSVSLINGARPCDVFWHVDSSASFAGGSFVGTIIAVTSITFGDGVSLNGRALALTGNVTLINNSIGGPSCDAGSTATPTQTNTPGPSPTPTSTFGPGTNPPPTDTPVPTLAPAATATNVPTFPSYVDVATECAVNGQGRVLIGMSAGVTVYGLGADITSAVDTGPNKIVRFLPVGHYDWHATPPANHYMQTASSGSIDIPECGTPGAGGTAVPGATNAAAVTLAPTAPAELILVPATGADLAGEAALASHRWLRVGLGAVGLGLVCLGFGLNRKRKH